MTDSHHSPPSFTCPKCAMTNYSPRDVGVGWCHGCQDWTEGYVSDPCERVTP